jgi:hypothetical protein
MTKPKDFPRNAVVVRRYQELDSFAQAFAAGHLRFLMVVGPPGTGKSRTMRRVVDGQVAWIDGNATPFGVYCAAFVHQDKPIVLDDVDALYRDTNGIRLLKQLCQSEPSRLLGWHSDPQGLERRGVPATFTTSSSVAIIANRWSTMNADGVSPRRRGTSSATRRGRRSATKSPKTLVSVRAIAASPFAEDRGRAFYFAGFDCNSIPSHNTAWIYRGEMRSK